MFETFGNLAILMKRANNMQHVEVGSEVAITEAKVFHIVNILIVINYKHLAVLICVS